MVMKQMERTNLFSNGREGWAHCVSHLQPMQQFVVKNYYKHGGPKVDNTVIKYKFSYKIHAMSSNTVHSLIISTAKQRSYNSPTQRFPSHTHTIPLHRRTLKQ